MNISKFTQKSLQAVQDLENPALANQINTCCINIKMTTTSAIKLEE